MIEFLPQLNLNVQLTFNLLTLLVACTIILAVLVAVLLYRLVKLEHNLGATMDFLKIPFDEEGER